MKKEATNFSGQSLKHTPKSNKCRSKAPTKLENVLSYLCRGNSLNRFEAEKLVNDHCLNSTMSSVKNRYGVIYRSMPEIVPGSGSRPTRVMRYWLEEESCHKAKLLLARLKTRRIARLRRGGK